MIKSDGGAMIDKPDDGIWFLLLILTAAISGAIGGCAGAAHIFLSQEKPIRLMQVVAYGMLGMFLGMLSFGLLSAGSYYGFIMFRSVEALIGFSLAFGFLGSLFLSGTNVILHWTTKHLGDWEIKFTARQDTEERRRKR
ncbi:MAG: hypothetical protein BMS9Abin02_1991 [Anaerolineae bacterium]|nr:MAG: hypothetical protein BMS9Abin02_1991 [Anaerolineae bacterium]